MMATELDIHGTRRVNMLRQVKLRPEAAAFYPALPSNQWLPAAEVAARLLNEAAKRGEAPVACDRILSEAHFEFQGGGREEMLRYRARTRWSDYPGSHTR